MLNKFKQRKQEILNKKDKSSIGKWDKKIISLCDKINSLKNHYTTSSCSGRIVLIIENEKKRKNLFLKIYHNLITFEQLKKDLKKINSLISKNIKLKQEPIILHIACKNLKSAQELLDKARISGMKKSGILSSNSRIILEINSTEKLEFPIIQNQEILVSDKFLKIITKKANQNLKKSWKKIEKLEKLINS